MNKKIVDLSRSEQGQSLIIIAAVFVGLVALAGLAIDGGNLFVERRQAQNAADASALAGTRLVTQAIQTCAAIDMPAFDAEVDRTINRYAEQNGVTDTNGVAGDEVNDNVIGYYVDKDGTSLGQVGETGELPLGTAGVRVEVKDAHETFFLPVVGIKEIPSSAPAMALTGVVKQFPGGGPLLPIAVPKQVTDAVGTDEEWEVLDNLDGQFCYTDKEGEHCIEDQDLPRNAQRGWLNLNHIFNIGYLDGDSIDDDFLNRTFEKSADDSDCPKVPLKPGERPEDKSDLPGLKGYASGLCPYSLPIIAGPTGDLEGDGRYGDFIHGLSGATVAGMRAVYEGYAGQTVYAPVFDQVYLREEMVAEFEDGAASPYGFSNGGGFASAGGGSGDSYYYHIVGWVAVGVKDTQDNHILYGTFQKAVVSGGILPSGYSGSGACTAMVHGIALWE